MTSSLLALWFSANDAADQGCVPAQLTRRSQQSALPANDASTVARIRAGDEAAFDALYVQTFQELWSFARRYTDVTVAEEVVQDVFLRLWERRHLWDVRSTVRAYLFGAVRNRALHHVDRAAVEARAALALPQPSDLSVPVDERGDILDAVTRAVAALPERQRAAMILRIQRSLTHAEIGDALGVSSAAAGALVRKAEAKLRVALAAYLPE
jgi:RNA polymerase sigma-70 factor (ECF subfamily)